MSLRDYVFATVRHYWRTNAAIVAGVAAATAVIGGALLVGASMRSSLEQMTLDRLAGIDHVLAGGRGFREELADDLLKGAGDGPAFELAPAIILPGSLTAEERGGSPSEEKLQRAGGVQVYGVNDRFWSMTSHAAIEPPQPGEIVLNRRTADELGVDEGHQVSLVVEIPPSIPRDSLLGERSETVVELTLRVSAIAGDELTQGRFGLNPSQQLPRNAFVSLAQFQDQLGLAHVSESPRGDAEQPARVNTLFVSMNSTSGDDNELSPDAADRLSQQLNDVWTLDDLALRIVKNEEHGYCSLESRQLILDSALADAAKKAVETINAKEQDKPVVLSNTNRETGANDETNTDEPKTENPERSAEPALITSPVLVYLINEISNANATNDDSLYSMYAVTAGVKLSDKPPYSPEPPFGPFEWVAEPDGPIGEGELVINDWLAEDLQATRGDEVRIKYHQVGDRGELPEIDKKFRVAGVVKLAGVADDRGFTPAVPGITDVESLGDWRQPFPLKLNRVTPRDDAYWDPQDQTKKAYRATPKVFLPLAEAQNLWKSRYGGVTSFRFAPSGDQSLDEAASRFERTLLESLAPRNAGLAFQPVKDQGLQAARGTTDFAGLFVGFSFFLILAAAILVGLLFRLNLEQRLSELGLLSAVGFTPRRTRRLMLGEGGALIAIGGLLGCVLAIGFAGLIIYGLTTWWVGAVGTTFLRLSIDPASLVTGLVIAAVVAAVAVIWAMRLARRVSIRRLLSGTLESMTTVKSRARRRNRAWLTALISGLLAAVLGAVSLVGLMPQQEAFAGLAWPVVVFFVIGIAALVCGISLLAIRLSAEQSAAIHGRTALLSLAVRNAGRQRGRSLLTVCLIAAATFLIVAIAAGHRNPAVEQPVRDSGNGGYTLVAETSVPLLFDLNTEQGRADLGVDVPDEIQPLLGQTHVAALRIKPGEDASCLNLYRTQLPTILGVPDELISQWTSEGRFRFVGAGGAHPWDVLRSDEGSATIPVIGDMNTLQYSLHLGMGDTIEVPQSSHKLEISGVLDGSVFQGVLLMSEENLHRIDKDVDGFGYFLVEVPQAEGARISQWLETELSDFGFDSERVADRLAGFLAVQNTYLSTFQALGGLGLLLGTFGLGTVMLRNVLERRSELALLKAVGFRNRRIALLVLYENGLLMFWGLAAGTAAALIAMMPHLASTGADVPWGGLVLLLAAVAVVGMATAGWAVRAAVGAPTVAALRGE